MTATRWTLCHNSVFSVLEKNFQGVKAETAQSQKANSKTRVWQVTDASRQSYVML